LWAETVQKFISHLSSTEQDRILGGTATEVYGLANMS